jgi:hypothetical protein
MTVAEPIGTLQEQMVCIASVSEPDGFFPDRRQPCAGVQTRYGDLSPPLAAGRGRDDELGLACAVNDTIGLMKRVQRMCRSGLMLTPAAMAGMDDQWRSRQTVPGLAVLRTRSTALLT